MLRALLVASLVSVIAGEAYAVSTVGFDDALPLAPQKVTVGGSVAVGDDILTLAATARMGLLDELEAVFRGGIVHWSEESGFEAELGGLFRFLRVVDTDAADLAFLGTSSVLKTGDRFVFGLDPALVASRPFPLAEGREFFVSATLGGAVTFYDVDEGRSDTELGFLGALAAGVDVLPGVRLSLEARLRDDAERFGASLTYDF